MLVLILPTFIQDMVAGLAVLAETPTLPSSMTPPPALLGESPDTPRPAERYTVVPPGLSPELPHQHISHVFSLINYI